MKGGAWQLPYPRTRAVPPKQRKLPGRPKEEIRRQLIALRAESDQVVSQLQKAKELWFEWF
jgi:hypothetical protein